jgi:hypothetical protein
MLLLRVSCCLQHTAAPTTRAPTAAPVVVEQQSSSNTTAAGNGTTAVKNLPVVTLRLPTSIRADSYDYIENVSSNGANDVVQYVAI